MIPIHSLENAEKCAKGQKHHNTVHTPAWQARCVSAGAACWAHRRAGTHSDIDILSPAGRKPTIQVSADWFLPSLAPWRVDATLSLCPHKVTPLCTCVLTSSSYKDPSHTGLGHPSDLI